MKLNKVIEKYNKLDSSLSSSSVKVNHEVIAFQNDEPFIDRACSAIDTILAVANGSRAKLKTTEGKKALAELSKIFTDRFNIQFAIECDDEECNGYSVCFSPIMDQYLRNTQFTNISGTLENIEKLKKNSPETYKNLTEKDVDISKVKGLEDYWNNYANISTINLFKSIKDSKFELDLKNARVKSGKNMLGFIAADFIGFDKKNCNSKEILAILLHEVGHAFNELERVYMVYNNVFILQDVLVEEYAKKNKTPADVLKIFYSKTDLEQDKDKPSTIAGVILAANKSIIRGIKPGRVTGYDLSNHEQLADEFAARFGLGAEIISAFEKADYLTGFDERSAIAEGSVIAIGSSIATTLYASVAAVAGLSIFVIIALLISLIIMWLGIDNILNINKNGTVYDTIDRRMQRLRNTTVRRLSTIDDPKARDHMLAQIEYLDNKLAEMKKIKSNNWAIKIVNAIGKLDTLAYQERELNDLIDNMFANDLHVASTMWNKK